MDEQETQWKTNLSPGGAKSSGGTETPVKITSSVEEEFFRPIKPSVWRKPETFIASSTRLENCRNLRLQNVL
ncbi:hypothetical protein Q5P01_008849 [Channa striata]|uniref:Uncharacterized protein n=1 Tax=Channa striata TaxID=64152 RepID=A0AA88N2T3_CHASR|nr:hypothetical protein Q5P01_008849 [Channa striata]